MRKPRRRSVEELAPYVWATPEHLHAAWGERPLPTDSPIQPIDWALLFGNTNPVEIEVGFGKGLYLVTTGEANPNRNFFGIEIIRKYQLYAATRVANRDLKNVITTCADARQVFRHYIVPGSVNDVHVYYPDPWWKSRHEKRKLMNEDFAQLIVQVLRPGGQFHFVTDVADYYAMVTEMLAELPMYLRQPDPVRHDPTHDMDYLTNFERKFRREGRPVYRALYRRADSAQNLV
ncbi:MAG: tRNA (guanosine(46)-N7)-methyltransferase TrmB [Gemmataceae bacterium]